MSYNATGDTSDFGEGVMSDFQLKKSMTIVDDVPDNVLSMGMSRCEDIPSEVVLPDWGFELANWEIELAKSNVKQSSLTGAYEDRKLPLINPPSDQELPLNIRRKALENILQNTMFQDSSFGGKDEAALLCVADDAADFEQEGHHTLFPSIYYDKTYQEFLNDAADGISGHIDDLDHHTSSYPELNISVFPPPSQEFIRDSAFTDDVEFFGDNEHLAKFGDKKLVNSLPSSFGVPKRVLIDDDDDSQDSILSGTINFYARLSIEHLPVSRGIRLITSGSSIEPRLLGSEILFKYETLRDVASVSSPQSAQLPKEEENTKRTLRRSKEATIAHSDFANLEEGDLVSLFYVVSPEPRKKRSLRQKSKSKSKDPALNYKKHKSLTYTSHDTHQIKCINETLVEKSKNEPLFISLYSKDMLGMNGPEMPPEELHEDLQFGGDEPDINDSEVWLNALNSAFDIDDDILDDILFDHAIIPTLLTTLQDSLPLEMGFHTNGKRKEPNNNLASVNDLERVHSVSALSLASAMVSEMFKKLSGKAHHNSEVSPIEDPAESATVLDAVMNTLMSQATVSPPGTVIAYLYAEEVKKAKSRRSLFHEKIPSTSTKIDQLTHQETQSSDWKLNNRLINARNPDAPKKRRSIRKIFSGKSPPNDEVNAGELNPKPSKADLHSHASTDNSERDQKKTGTIISLKSLWRSKSTIRSHQRKVSNFNLESGESLSGYAAEYASTRELGSPRVSSAFEAQRMWSLMADDLLNQIPETAGSEETGDDTLTSLMEDKLRGLKSISEYIPTPAPVAPMAYQFEEADHKGWLGLRRFKTLNYLKKDRTIRFATDPVYITESVSKLGGVLTGEAPYSTGSLNSLFDSSIRTRSILKRQGTLNSSRRGHGLKSFFSSKVE